LQDGHGRARADALIAHHELQAHPEGGWYRRVYSSDLQLTLPHGERPAITSILYLLRKGEVSRWHRVRSDELWHYCEGAPLRLWRSDVNLLQAGELRLGLAAGAQPMQPIPAGCWQAAESLGDYTLVCCTVAPGFDFADFMLMADDADVCARLRRRHAELARLI
jgi:predicted cupin superfamily sugar epimerase